MSVKINNAKLLLSSKRLKNILFLKSHRNYCRNYSKVEIAAGYKPSEVETEHNEVFKEIYSTVSSKNDHKPKFSMILPPPNVTGNLHLGHALMLCIQDVICRRKRQEGYNVVWVPGTDHAGIATQVVVEKKLLKEKNISRHQLGREEFLSEIWKWKNEKEQSIIHDMKKLGMSINWELEYFTMDGDRIDAVNEAFVRLFEAGLIQRQNSLVNWSCALESSISDIEVNSMEIKSPTLLSVPGHAKQIIFGQIYDISYKEYNGTDEIVVSTTRPETLLGDVAVAINPNDPRYSKYLHNPIKLWHPFRNEPIPVVMDESVDPEFGTGAVKITPGHDKNDFEIAKRHKLESITVIDSKGRILNEFESFANLPRFEARNKILDSLSEMGLFKGVRPHSMQLPICSRSEDVIEYMTRPQWFLDCKEMSQSAIQAVKDEKIKIFPTNFENEWNRWLLSCRDWCISRQLWWGHQIPAYECEFNGKSVWFAAKTKEDALKKSSAHFAISEDQINIVQDPDVLDTWFSSSLLPFSAFNWPNNKYKHYYPLDLMETGHDILFFWVARMAMMGLKLTGQVPFRNILLHGIVCDAHGRKMSKSLGNVVLPEQVIHGATIKVLEEELQNSFNCGTITSDELEKSSKGLKKLFPKGIPECGTDALRFTLCSHNLKNHFISFDVNECYTNKLFFNKIWQATKYTLAACEKYDIDIKSCSIIDIELNEMDKWILSRLANTRKLCNQSFANYNFHHAVNALKTFFYSNLCDVYLETTKPGIQNSPDLGKNHCAVLSTCLSLGLQTMSPFTPFLSQKLLSYFSNYENIIDSNFINNSLETEVEEILNVCLAIRQLKSQNQISKKHEPKIHLFPENDKAMKLLCKYKDYIRTLSLSNDVIMENGSNHKRKDKLDVLSTAGHLCTFGISTNEQFTKNKVESGLNEKKLKKLQQDLNKLLKTISSEGYKKSATMTVQETHLEKVKQLEKEIRNIQDIS